MAEEEKVMGATPVESAGYVLDTQENIEHDAGASPGGGIQQLPDVMVEPAQGVPGSLDAGQGYDNSTATLAGQKDRQKYLDPTVSFESQNATLGGTSGRTIGGTPVAPPMGALPGNEGDRTRPAAPLESDRDPGVPRAAGVPIVYPNGTVTPPSRATWTPPFPNHPGAAIVRPVTKIQSVIFQGHEITGQNATVGSIPNTRAFNDPEGGFDGARATLGGTTARTI